MRNWLNKAIALYLSFSKYMLQYIIFSNILESHQNDLYTALEKKN